MRMNKMKLFVMSIAWLMFWAQRMWQLMEGIHLLFTPDFFRPCWTNTIAGPTAPGPTHPQPTMIAIHLKVISHHSRIFTRGLTFTLNSVRIAMKSPHLTSTIMISTWISVYRILWEQLQHKICPPPKLPRVNLFNPRGMTGNSKTSRFNGLQSNTIPAACGDPRQEPGFLLICTEFYSEIIICIFQ